MTNISFILQECHQQGVLLSIHEQEGLHFKPMTGKIRKSLKERLIENKIKIVQHLQEAPLSLEPPVLNDKKEQPSISDDINSNPQVHNVVPFTPISHVTTLTSEKILHYRRLLEASLANPKHDPLHSNDLPKKFRAREHTFEEISLALETFIRLSPSEQTRFRILPDTIAQQEVEVSRKVDAALDTLIEAQEALPEYQVYQRCRDHTCHGHDQKACDDVLDTYQKALIALPEFKALRDEKRDQYKLKLQHRSHEKIKKETLAEEKDSISAKQREEVKNNADHTEGEEILPTVVPVTDSIVNGMPFDLPVPWATAIERIQTRLPPQSINAQRWHILLQCLNQLITMPPSAAQDEGIPLFQMIRQGWQPEDLFGCHKFNPEGRHDAKGLLLLMKPDHKITGITKTSASLQFTDPAGNPSLMTYRLLKTCDLREVSTLMAVA